MKKKLIALVLMLALVLTFGLVACGGEEAGPFRQATAFGDTHWNGMGAVTVVVDAEDKIVNVIFDEIFLPFAWSRPAAYNATSNNKVPAAWDATAITANTIAANTAGNTVAMNKFIRIGDKYFEADTTVTLTRGSRIALEYKQIGGGINKLHEYVLDATNQNQGQWFYEEALLGNCWVVMEKDATKTNPSERFADVYPAVGNAINTVHESINKRVSQYWTPTFASQDGADLQKTYGLQANYAYLASFLINRGKADYALSDITLTEGTDQVDIATNAKVKVGNVVTQASMADGKLYLTVAKTAWELACAK